MYCIFNTEGMNMTECRRSRRSAGYPDKLEAIYKTFILQTAILEVYINIKVVYDENAFAG